MNTNKVKIMSSIDYETLEYQINEFAKNHEIVSISLSCFTKQTCVVNRAIILYKGDIPDHG